MDELPNLQSDADVDALMARIQARIAPAAATPASNPADVPDAPPGSLAALAAAQEKLALTLLRALNTVAESFEELEADAVPAVRPPRRVKPAAKVRRRARP